VASLTKRALWGALVFCLAAAGAAPARAADPIVIGEINPLTGALALQGTTVHQGIVLAIEEQNARDGIAAPGQEAESHAFVEAFAKRFGVQAAPLAMHGYAAARTLLAALEAAAWSGRPLMGPGLRDALVAADVMTPMGGVRFDERGDPVSCERVILQIQDGRHVMVWPKERAQAAAR